MSVQSVEISEEGQGSSAQLPQDSNVIEKSDVKSADTSQITIPSSGLSNLSTNSETKSRLNVKIGNTDQKRQETAIVKPTATAATSLRTRRNESLTIQAHVSKTFAKNGSHEDSAKQDKRAEESSKADDKSISLTTTKKATKQPKIEVSTVHCCSRVLCSVYLPLHSQNV